MKPEMIKQARARSLINTYYNQSARISITNALVMHSVSVSSAGNGKGGADSVGDSGAGCGAGSGG